ncbi:MAG: RimK/LysX family protein [Halobacteriaceae archaeon]
MSDSVRVGVLSFHNSKETKAICNAVEALGHTPAWLREENTQIRIQDGDVEVSPAVDIIVNRLLLTNTSQPAELLGLGRTLAHAAPMLNPPGQVLTAIHKFATATALAEADVRVPDALLALDDGALNEALSGFGPEAVYKTAIGTHGGGTWKVSATDHVNPRVGQRYAFLQALIEGAEAGSAEYGAADGGEGGVAAASGEDGRAPERDLRVYVVDGEIIASMYRYAPESDWRTNVALGGEVEGVTELPAEAEDFALRATQALGLDYAGVDLVEGRDGWYVLEVNPTAGFKGLFRATGTSPAPHIATAAIERAGGTVDDERVRIVADELDDAEPSCTPTGRAAGGEVDERKTIGYTEEVLVSGTSDTERIVAKSDTGASRTSVDTQLAASVGAGPIKDMTTVRSGSTKQGRSRPVVDIVVGIGGDRHTVAASLEDRSHMQYPLLLGRDILSAYQVDVGRQADEERTGE